MTTRGILALLSALSVASCGGASSGSSGSFAEAGSGSPSSASNIYQTPQGFCSSDPKLSGGDLTGTWTVVAACGISTNSPANCPDATVTLSLTATGSVTFNPDDTGSIELNVALEKKSTLPVTCSSNGDCASLQSELALEVGADAGASATCTPSSTDSTQCDRDPVFSPDVVRGSGSYTLDLPTYLTSQPLGLHGGFLVQGNTLRLDGLTERGTEFVLAPLGN
jgi:hypothetical protein